MNVTKIWDFYDFCSKAGTKTINEHFHIPLQKKKNNKSPLYSLILSWLMMFNFSMWVMTNGNASYWDNMHMEHTAPRYLSLIKMTKVMRFKISRPWEQKGLENMFSVKVHELYHSPIKHVKKPPLFLLFLVLRLFFFYFFVCLFALSSQTLGRSWHTAFHTHTGSAGSFFL